MKIVSSAKTDIGRVRRNNEDAFLVDDMLGLYVVADGMGGHAGGETASRLAVESLREAVREYHAGRATASPPSAPDALQDGFVRANRAVLEAGLRDPELRGMGTTMTALLADSGGVHLAHLGDSRAYRLRQGRFEQLTEDHTPVADQVRAGLLTPELARTSPYRHIISRAVGIDPDARADVTAIGAERGDIYLLCSDGLTDMLADGEIAEAMADGPFSGMAQRLVEQANHAGGVDNITVVVLQVEDGR